MAKFVKTGAYIAGIVVDSSAYLAEKGRVFNLLKKLGWDETIVGGIKLPRFGDRLKIIKFYKWKVRASDLNLPTEGALSICMRLSP